MQLMNLLKQFLKSISNPKKQWTNTLTKIWLWGKKKNIYNKKVTVIRFVLVDNNEEKVRDHCHGTDKVRGAAHWNCNINLQLTIKVPVIFHNLRGYDSHLIFCELDKFDVKISVLPNGLEKCMAFFSFFFFE